MGKPDLQEYIATLRNAGFRITESRTAICRYLSRSTTHPTAQQIYDQLKQGYPTLSLTTVYMTLDMLVHLGLVTALGTAGDEAVHFEPNTSPHVNLACMNCHRIVDLPSSRVNDLAGEVERTSGAKVLGGSVLYYTNCINGVQPVDCSCYRQLRAGTAEPKSRQAVMEEAR